MEKFGIFRIVWGKFENFGKIWKFGKTKLEIWEKKLEIWKKNPRNLEKFVNWEKIRTLENNFEIWKKFEEFWNLKKRIKSLNLWEKNIEN